MKKKVNSKIEEKMRIGVSNRNEKKFRVIDDDSSFQAMNSAYIFLESYKKKCKINFSRPH